MQANQSNPLKGVASAALLLVFFLLFWQVATALLGLAFAYIGLCRYVEWARARRTTAATAIWEWAPFAAILLTAILVK